MKNIKVCSFVANYTHSCIVANNFIAKEFSNAKVIYINERSEKEKLKNIVNKYFRNLNEKILYMEWLNEEVTNDYVNENIILVINGSENFINKVNSYLCFLQSHIIVINCYNIVDIKSNINDIIEKHDYYLNTNGIEIRHNNIC